MLIQATPVHSFKLLYGVLLYDIVSSLPVIFMNIFLYYQQCCNGLSKYVSCAHLPDAPMISYLISVTRSDLPFSMHRLTVSPMSKAHPHLAWCPWCLALCFSA